MTPWKWALVWAACIFLISATIMYSVGASFAYALFAAAASLLAVVAFLFALWLPIAIGIWLIRKIAPEGECCTCLTEAIWLRIVAIRQSRAPR